jgi:triacylglycerol lipase
MDNVQLLTGDKYASYGLLVMYAWDMCDKDLDPSANGLDPRIEADGWTVVGIISGADDIVSSGPGGIRQQMIRPSGPADRKRYGYLAKSKSENRYVAVIRGTDGAEEWFDDFVFVAGTRPQFPGRVETGFADIYLSMQYRPLAPAAAAGNLAAGIKEAVGDADVLVLGHSLGAALATCLAYELAAPTSLGSAHVGAILFASPKLGDHEFVSGFAARITNYVVINYEHDLVPRVPPFDITHFDLYRTLPYCLAITDETAMSKIDSADPACCHHLVDYLAMLSPSEYHRAAVAPGWTADDASCAQCIAAAQLAKVASLPAAPP